MSKPARRPPSVASVVGVGWAGPAQRQYTQGMPYFAFGLTVTGAPAWPLFDAEVGVVVGEAPGEPLVLLALPGVTPGGTAVASAPSRTSTWPAATVLLGEAVSPSKYPAIVAALACAPGP
jgi:hypothetical protein